MLRRKLLLLLFFVTSVAIVLLIYWISNKGSIITYNSSDKKRYPRSATSTEPFVLVENRTVADELSQKIRILCWIMTFPNNHWKKAIHVKETWGRRCNILLFMSTEREDSLPTVKLPIPEGKDFLWGKTKAALKYIYANYREEADWFLKADDDTFIVLENLRHYLSYFQTERSLFLGAHLKYVSDQRFPVLGYMDGGAGYVLSRSALDEFVNVCLKAPLCEDTNSGQEDIELAKCFAYCEVEFIDTQDAQDRSRFHPLLPITHIDPDLTYWNWMCSQYPWKVRKGLNCCSPYSISFHRVTPHKMYELEYFVYKLRPYGISYR